MYNILYMEYYIYICVFHLFHVCMIMIMMIKYLVVSRSKSSQMISTAIAKDLKCKVLM